MRQGGHCQSGQSGQITVDQDRLRQTRFNTCRIMRHYQPPQIDSVRVDSTHTTGVIGVTGEPAATLTGPALTWAVDPD